MDYVERPKCEKCSTTPVMRDSLTKALRKVCYSCNEKYKKSKGGRFGTLTVDDFIKQ